MSFSFSCSKDHAGVFGDPGQRAHPAEHLVAVIVRVSARADEEGEDPDVRRGEEAATSAACRIRTRCGSKSSSMKILPIGEPMLDTARP